MDMAWRPLFSVIILSALIALEEWLSSPSCQTLTPFPNPNASVAGDLKVMMVANLLLSGSGSGSDSDSGRLARIFRDHHAAKFFKKSFLKLEPDLLVVMGDLSARGSELTRSRWNAVVRQFHALLGPFPGIPVHVVLGDKDVGRCGELGAETVDWIAARFTGLDETGCAAFELGNMSFLSLNSAPLLCGESELRFGVEKVVERESMGVRGGGGGEVGPGAGPVLLVHFPLRENHGGDGDGSGFVGDDGPYGSVQSLPPNVTEYIFRALKPRIIFSGHSYDFSVHIHPDGTSEVAVPATTWNAKDDPGFIVSIFRQNTKAVSIIYCALPRESRVIRAYISVLILLASILFLMKIHHWLISRR